MTTLYASNLKDRVSAKQVKVLTLVDGSEKSWVVINGLSTPASPRASCNVSTVLDNGVGVYSYTMMTPMLNVYYVVKGYAINPAVSWQYWSAACNTADMVTLVALHVARPSDFSDSGECAAAAVGRLA